MIMALRDFAAGGKKRTQVVKWCMSPDFEVVCKGAGIPAEPMKKSLALLLNSKEAVIRYHCARLESGLVSNTLPDTTKTSH